MSIIRLLLILLSISGLAQADNPKCIGAPSCYEDSKVCCPDAKHKKPSKFKTAEEVTLPVVKQPPQKPVEVTKDGIIVL